MKTTEIGTSNSVAVGAAVEMGTTPFPVGGRAVLVMYSKGAAYVGAAKVQVSDDNSTWTDLAGASLSALGMVLMDVTVAKYMRINGTAWTSGSITAALIGG